MDSRSIIRGDNFGHSDVLMGCLNAISRAVVEDKGVKHTITAWSFWMVAHNIKGFLTVF
jgi:hypothetical protein